MLLLGVTWCEAGCGGTLAAAAAGCGGCHFLQVCHAMEPELLEMVDVFCGHPEVVLG